MFGTFGDALLRPSDPPQAVIDAIRQAFGSRDGQLMGQAEDIIKNLRYYPGDDLWGFTRWGMFVGVERDGYIHT